MASLRNIVLTLLALGVASPLLKAQDSADSSRLVRIDNVFIIGNDKTKPRVILREMDYKKGDEVEFSTLVENIKEVENKIFNTRLFNSVKVRMAQLSPELVDIIITVKERWYIFPVPRFKLADRNFNDWWQNQGHSLDRVEYGIWLYINNFRGRGEQLRIIAQTGFSDAFGLRYRIPAIDNQQKVGLEINFLFREQKNLAVQTIDHDRLFLDSEEVLSRDIRAAVKVIRRNSFYVRHAFDVEFRRNIVNDTVPILNPNFFLDSRGKQKYILLAYTFSDNHSDVLFYPLKGYHFLARIRKQGIGVFGDLDRTDLLANYSRYIDLDKGFFLSNFTGGYVSFPQQQPYKNIQGLGYGIYFLRGYELDLIEGQNYVLNKTTFKKRIAFGETHLGTIPFKEFRTIPYAFYLKTYLDLGYVDNLVNYEINDRLTNRFIFGGGLGIDFVSYYDLVIRFEYSWNNVGENGFFLHYKKEF